MRPFAPPRAPRTLAALRALPVRAVIAAGTVLGLAACDPEPAAPPAVERMWPAMGTFASVAVPAAVASRLDAAADLTRQAVSDVELELSGFLPESLVSRLNAAAGDAAVFAVTPHAAAVFRLSEDGHARSGGAFDPTVGPFMQLWGFRGTNAPPAAPDASALTATGQRVGWRRVVWQDGQARLDTPGMRLDFGAVAKGYAVDVAFARLRREGFTDLMVNLGGNLRCLGAARPNRAGWVVSVRDPYLPYGGGSVGTLTLTAGRATATSGRYERFVEIAGRRYAHVIDPRSGQPVGGMAQVTVVAATAGEADVLSTSLFVLGMDAGCAMLSDYPGATALFIPDPAEGEDPRAWASPGFLEGFTVAAEWAGRVAALPAKPTR